MLIIDNLYTMFFCHSRLKCIIKFLGQLLMLSLSPPSASSVSFFWKYLMMSATNYSTSFVTQFPYGLPENYFPVSWYFSGILLHHVVYWQFILWLAFNLFIILATSFLVSLQVCFGACPMSYHFFSSPVFHCQQPHSPPSRSPLWSKKTRNVVD